jgi:hypothetical protein
MGEKPYWAGQSYTIHSGWRVCVAHWRGVGGRSTSWVPDADCEQCKRAVEMNEKKGLMVPPAGRNQEVMKDTNVAPEGGAKYSFTGRPDFGRIIRENEGADVIIVSREDGMVCFLFNVGESNTHPAGSVCRLPSCRVPHRKWAPTLRQAISSASWRPGVVLDSPTLKRKQTIPSSRDTIITSAPLFSRMMRPKSGRPVKLYFAPPSGATFVSFITSWLRPAGGTINPFFSFISTARLHCSQSASGTHDVDRPPTPRQCATHTLQPECIV